MSVSGLRFKVQQPEQTPIAGSDLSTEKLVSCFLFRALHSATVRLFFGYDKNFL